MIISHPSKDPCNSLTSQRGKQSCQKKVMPAIVAHDCNPSDWETETGGSGVKASLGYTVSSRPP
jgi:hypothetical protein